MMWCWWVKVLVEQRCPEARRHDGLAATATEGGRRSGQGERDGDARLDGEWRRARDFDPP